jgi:hypothetical protein
MDRANLSQVLNIDNFPIRYATDLSRNDALLRFNERLEEEASLIRLNEAFLESKLEELERLSSSQERLLWLILARLTELTLICAGNYAEGGCVTEVGDLLFNPRQILVHIRGQQHPVVKERHTPLTVQFQHMAKTRNGVVDWLKDNTILETVKKPILPHLVDLLEKNHSASAEAYLASVRQRSVRIAELTGRLSIQIGATPENSSCRFDWDTFHFFGHEIRALAQGDVVSDLFTP